ncbi:cytidyltransferase [Desulfovibrio psychrotolerans]|uniref:Cytidyltransferase n=2 Tax=Desulfovibrio psychrotolerans TaxID=415242 RepID=A0A7J0BWT4_9BACT|nr:cytidyltransferase [Desulfovibrio psychrotolerans]
MPQQKPATESNDTLPAPETAQGCNGHTMPPVPDHPAVFSAARRDALLAALAPHRGRRIVFTNGCYDIVHPGHADLLARARALGDLLVLGLNSDASVRSLGKGTDRPVNPFPVRAYVLAHLAAVDFVAEFEEPTPYELIRAVRPQILVKGGDWSVDRIVGRDLVEADGGTVVSLPLLPGFSTTALLERIRATR